MGWFFGFIFFCFVFKSWWMELIRKKFPCLWLTKLIKYCANLHNSRSIGQSIASNQFSILLPGTMQITVWNQTNVQCFPRQLILSIAWNINLTGEKMYKHRRNHIDYVLYNGHILQKQTWGQAKEFYFAYVQSLTSSYMS